MLDVSAKGATAFVEPLAVGELTAEGLEVFEGLSDGDYLVTAGVHKLLDGQTVKFTPPQGEVETQ